MALSESAKRAKAKYRSNPENRRKEYETNKKWLARDGNAKRKQHRKRLATYGLTEEAYQVLINKQMGLCAICRRPPKPKASLNSPDNFAIDHCHVTNKVRGLLCESCNKALGLLEDSPEFCVSAALYLKENK